jgi:heat shock protein HslJ/uncharacterized protein YecT (DUF1311 family)
MRIQSQLWVMLVLIGGTVQAAEAPAPLTECYASTANRIAVGQCLDFKFAAAGTELAKAVSATHERMARLDAASGRQLAISAFDRSERAFVAFRRDNCAWLAAQLGAGTGSGDVERDCAIRMTRARTDELRSQEQAAQSAALPAPPAQHSGATITGHIWRLTRLLRDGQQLGLGAGSAPSIQFDEAGHVNGNASVNRFSGGYAIDASGALRWSEPGFAATRMAGPPELMRQEEWFLDALRRAVHVRVAGDTLVLSNDDETTVLTFGH